MDGQKIKLLIQSALAFKTKYKSDGELWEPKRAKYKTILETFISQYPENDCKKFPNKNKIDKKQNTAKLKAIRTGYKDCKFK